MPLCLRAVQTSRAPKRSIISGPPQWQRPGWAVCLSPSERPPASLGQTWLRGSPTGPRRTPEGQGTHTKGPLRLLLVAAISRACVLSARFRRLSVSRVLFLSCYRRFVCWTALNCILDATASGRLQTRREPWTAHAWVPSVNLNGGALCGPRGTRPAGHKGAGRRLPGTG